MKLFYMVEVISFQLVKFNILWYYAFPKLFSKKWLKLSIFTKVIQPVFQTFPRHQTIPPMRRLMM